MNLIGENINGFKIVSPLGEGGMGIVYKAFDTNLERFVAIKMLHPRPNRSTRSIHYFRKEARHQAKLHHPNIVVVHGLLEYNSLIGIIMECVEGITLSNLIIRDRKIEPNRTVEILKQILVAIDYAHSHGFIHRDIKPSNIIITNAGVVKIMDFGISKSMADVNLDSARGKVGTVFYMSPEMIEGKRVSEVSDIYSIGCTAYEMLSGYPPFYFNNEFAVLEAHVRNNPENLSNLVCGLPDWLNSVVMKALAKDTALRYQRCNLMLSDIQKEVVANSPSFHPPIAKKVEGEKNKVSLSGIFFLIITIAAIVLLALYIVRNIEVTSNPKKKSDKNSEQPLERFIK